MVVKLVVLNLNTYKSSSLRVQPLVTRYNLTLKKNLGNGRKLKPGIKPVISRFLTRVRNL